MRGPKNPRLRRGVVKASPSGEKFSSVLKLLGLCISIQIPNFSILTDHFLRYDGGPKIQDGVVVVRMRHLAEKIFNTLKSS